MVNAKSSESLTKADGTGNYVGTNSMLSIHELIIKVKD